MSGRGNLLNLQHDSVCAVVIILREMANHVELTKLRLNGILYTKRLTEYEAE